MYSYSYYITFVYFKSFYFIGLLIIDIGMSTQWNDKITLFLDMVIVKKKNSVLLNRIWVLSKNNLVFKFEFEKNILTNNIFISYIYLY